MKNRDNIYLVVREDITKFGEIHVAICNAYTSVQAADEAASRENQRWKEKGWSDEPIFSVRITTIYDE